MYCHIDELLSSIGRDASDTAHPLAALRQDTNQKAKVLAGRIDRALQRVCQVHPAYFQSWCQRLIDDKNRQNTRSAIGELLALSDLTTVWGEKVLPRSIGADFIVDTTDGPLLIEAATVLGSTVNTEIEGSTHNFGNILLKETASAPFGYPTDSRPLDTVQGNAVSRLAAIKQSEHQASPDQPSVLWLDLNDPETFPISLGSDQTQPLCGGQSEIVSGVLWWANYGHKGDPVFDSFPFNGMGRRHYELEFDGRFARGSRFAAVVSSLSEVHVVHENHLLTNSALTYDQRLGLLQLPLMRFELCWLDWPEKNTLGCRVALARSQSRALIFEQDE